MSTILMGTFSSPWRYHNDSHWCRDGSNVRLSTTHVYSTTVLALPLIEIRHWLHLIRVNSLDWTLHSNKQIGWIEVLASELPYWCGNWPQAPLIGFTKFQTENQDDWIENTTENINQSINDKFHGKDDFFKMSHSMIKLEWINDITKYELRQ